MLHYINAESYYDKDIGMSVFILSDRCHNIDFKIGLVMVCVPEFTQA